MLSEFSRITTNEICKQIFYLWMGTNNYQPILDFFIRLNRYKQEKKKRKRKLIGREFFTWVHDMCKNDNLSISIDRTTSNHVETMMTMGRYKIELFEPFKLIMMNYVKNIIHDEFSKTEDHLKCMHILKVYESKKKISGSISIINTKINNNKNLSREKI